MEDENHEDAKALLVMLYGFPMEGEIAVLVKKSSLYEYPDSDPEAYFMSGEILAADHVLYVVEKISAIDGSLLYYVAHRD